MDTVLFSTSHQEMESIFLRFESRLLADSVRSGVDSHAFCSIFKLQPKDFLTTKGTGVQGK